MSVSSVFLHAFLFSSVCLIPLVEPRKRASGITVDLIHRDSPLSPSYNPSKTRFDFLKDAIHRSFARKSSLGLRSSSRTQDIEAPINNNGGAGYVMKVQIGTPPVEVVAIADTGSDLTWTQCKPCTTCFKQDFPLFDPSKTTSYKKVSCRSEQCTATGTSSCGRNSSCEYQVSYGDQSFSNGELAKETFTFSSPSGRNVAFPDIVFGCGNENGGSFSESESGIIGLGGGEVSIIKQLESSIGGKFSYCLTTLDSNVSSKISFGTNAVVKGRNVLTTPLVKGSTDTFYYLTLEGISVGNERLKYESSPNQVGDEGNIIIDSGTTLTFVPSEFYDGVVSALKNAIDGTLVSDPDGIFSLCYQSDGELSSPPITAHFTGADVELPNIFLEAKEGINCLSLVPSQDVAIFGNLHQVNYKIGYDLVNQKLNFLPMDCTKTN